MAKKKAKTKPKVKVLKIAKLAPNKVAVELEVEDAPELPSEVLTPPLVVGESWQSGSDSAVEPHAKNWMDWLRGLW